MSADDDLTADELLTARLVRVQFLLEQCTAVIEGAQVTIADLDQELALAGVETATLKEEVVMLQFENEALRRRLEEAP